MMNQSSQISQDASESQVLFLQKNNNNLLDNNFIIHPDLFEQFKSLFLVNNIPETRSAHLTEILRYQIGEDIIIKKLVQKNVQNQIDNFIIDLGDYVLKLIERCQLNQPENILLKRIIKIYKIAENRLNKQIRQLEHQTNYTRNYEDMCKKKRSYLEEHRKRLEQIQQQETVEEESKSEIQ